MSGGRFSWADYAVIALFTLPLIPVYLVVVAVDLVRMAWACATLEPGQEVDQ
jgi:hypothetical protein